MNYLRYFLNKRWNHLPVSLIWVTSCWNSAGTSACFHRSLSRIRLNLVFRSWWKRCTNLLACNQQSSYIIFSSKKSEQKKINLESQRVTWRIKWRWMWQSDEDSRSENMGTFMKQLLGIDRLIYAQKRHKFGKNNNLQCITLWEHESWNVYCNYLLCLSSTLALALQNSANILWQAAHLHRSECVLKPVS